MKEAIFNFLQMKVYNVTGPIYWAIALAMLALLGTTLHSIWTRRMGSLGKFLWSVTVVALPFAGIYLYLFYCFATADYSAFERFGFFRKKTDG